VVAKKLWINHISIHLSIFKRISPLQSSKNSLLNSGSNAVKTLHKPKQSYIYSPLGKTFCISYQDKFDYLLNFSLLLIIYIRKILHVSKRFSVERFVLKRQVEIFILNFSKYRVFLWSKCHVLYLANNDYPVILTSLPRRRRPRREYASIVAS
jgi:hypothetical protein